MQKLMLKISILIILIPLLISCKTKEKVITETKVVTEKVIIPPDTVVINKVDTIYQYNEESIILVDSAINNSTEEFNKQYLYPLKNKLIETKSELNSLKTHLKKLRYIAVDKVIVNNTIKVKKTKSLKSLYLYGIGLLIILALLIIKLCKFFTKT